ncbi:MAG: histidine kinase [Acidobacteria bacterium]|nr:histidine kinase [Acidobacteriota bacterium]
MLQRRWFRWFLVAGAWTLLGVFFASRMYVWRAFFNKPLPFSHALAFSFGTTLVWGALTPFVVAVAARLARLRLPLWRHVLIHSLSACIFSVAHIGIRLFVVLKLRLPIAQASSRLDQFYLSLIGNLALDIILYFTIVAAWHGLSYYQRFRERELRASDLEARLARARLQILTAQLHPHFLFNTLHSISTLMHRDVAAADRLMARLSDLLRMTLENVDRPQVALKQEMEFLAGYLEIEQTRFRDRLSVEVDVDPSALEARVPNMLLQPLVENALRYAVAPRSTPSRIRIRGRRGPLQLRLEVEDNGPGVPPGWQEPAKAGPGLANTRARLEQLYGTDQSLELRNLPEGGLRVSLLMPFCREPERAEADAAANSREAETAPTEANVAVTDAAHNLAELPRPPRRDPLLPERFWARWALVLAGWSALALFFSIENYAWVLFYGGATRTFARVLSWWLTHFYLWALLTPLVWLLLRRFPLERDTWKRNLLLHVPAGLTIVVLQTALWLPVAPLLGLPLPREMELWQMYKRFLVGDFHSNLMVYGSLLGIWNGLHYYRKYQQQSLAASRLEKHLTQTRLDVLQMQLQPHFLFNTLHAISTLMQRDVAAANRLIVRLSDLLRLTLEHAGEHVVPLQKELELLEQYLEIQRTRFQDRLTVRMDVDPETLDAQVPCLILQPLVENAVRHGIAPLSRPGRIEIRAHRQNGTLRLEVCDDGVGLSAGEGSYQGIGLGNTRARLAQLYGAAHALRMHSAPTGGLVVSVDIPFSSAA